MGKWSGPAKRKGVHNLSLIHSWLEPHWAIFFYLDGAMVEWGSEVDSVGQRNREIRDRIPLSHFLFFLSGAVVERVSYVDKKKKCGIRIQTPQSYSFFFLFKWCNGRIRKWVWPGKRKRAWNASSNPTKPVFFFWFYVVVVEWGSEVDLGREWEK
jgi:hypothetical protein